MRLSDMIANTFALLLLAGVVGGMFLAFAKPPWRGAAARIVLILPAAFTAASVCPFCRQACLPERFDLRLAPPRPKSI